MKTRDTALRLARRLVATTRSLGRRAAALVTDMSQPLGEAVGNALEVRESADVLRGGGPADVRDLTLDLAATMLVVCGAEPDRARAELRARAALESGAAWEKFLAMIAAQGGDASTVARADGLPRAPVVCDVEAERSGVVREIDTFGMGDLVVRIGGGRASKEDAIDPRVGLMMRARLGDRVERGAVLAHAHLAREDSAALAQAARCFRIEEGAAEVPALVLERVG
jgi:thymidine phosphorylase